MLTFSPLPGIKSSIIIRTINLGIGFKLRNFRPDTNLQIFREK